MLIKKGPKYGKKFNNAWQGSIEILRDIASLFALELRLAGKSLTLIAVLALFSIFFLLTIWICLAVIIVAWLMGYGLSMLTGIAVVMLVNFFLLIVFGIVMFFLAKNVNFRETRQQIHLLMEDEHE